MAATTGASWAQLRQQTRSAEVETESLFNNFSQFGALPDLPSSQSEDEKRIDAQIDALFDKRESLVSALTTVLDSDSAASQSAVRQSMLNRHREILQEHRRERQRLRNLIADNRARSSLLKNVRTDISNFRGANPAEQEENYMLDERGHIDSSHDMMDGLLSRAYAVNESLGFQRESLANINRKIIGAASQVPGLNTLIARIGSRKRRDSIIMGSLIALCVLLVLYFR